MSSQQSSQQGTCLPGSLVYRMSCEHFSRPLLVQQVYLESDDAVNAVLCHDEI